MLKKLQSLRYWIVRSSIRTFKGTACVGGVDSFRWSLQSLQQVWNPGLKCPADTWLEGLCWETSVLSKIEKNKEVQWEKLWLKIKYFPPHNKIQVKIKFNTSSLSASLNDSQVWIHGTCLMTRKMQHKGNFHIYFYLSLLNSMAHNRVKFGPKNWFVLGSLL